MPGSLVYNNQPGLLPSLQPSYPPRLTLLEADNSSHNVPIVNRSCQASKHILPTQFLSVITMSATTATQPVAAHQLRGAPGPVAPEARWKTGTTSKLSGTVDAQLSFFDPPKDGEKVSLNQCYFCLIMQIAQQC